MAKFQLFSLIFIVFQLSLSFSADLKCAIWMQGIEKMNKCCKFPMPIDEKALKVSAPKQNLTYCETYEKLEDLLGVKNADKTAYKNYLTKTIIDAEWKPIFLKSSDFCVDFAPKLVAPFAKKVKIPEVGCGTKFMLTMNCWMVSAYSECPAKFYTDSAECKELTKTIKECQENTADIVKAFEAPE